MNVTVCIRANANIIFILFVDCGSSYYRKLHGIGVIAYKLIVLEKNMVFYAK